MEVYKVQFPCGINFRMSGTVFEVKRAIAKFKMIYADSFSGRSKIPHAQIAYYRGEKLQELMAKERKALDFLGEPALEKIS